MYTWFECKVRYEKLDEQGVPRKVTEPYLVDAMSFTEAEARISREIQPYISGEFVISNITRAKVSELIEDDNPDSDRWFKSRVVLTIVDVDKGTEKKVAATFYVKAVDIDMAIAHIREHMGSSATDYVIASVAETPLMDVYHYEEPVPAGKVPLSTPPVSSNFEDGTHG